jgi:formate hydrogenlyase subunit 3/multisubunit Na+/H+ antiporter MnhD subunit
VAAVSGLIMNRPGWTRAVPYLAGAAGAGCLAVAGGFALAGRAVAVNVAGWLGDPLPGQQALGLAADRLSGMFLLMVFGAAVPVSVAFANWAAKPDAAVTRMLAEGYALALGSVTVIVMATDAFTALFGWEALTVAFYFMAGASRRDPDRGGGARITVAFGKVSGAALLIGLLLLATGSHSIALGSFAHAPAGAARTTALVLLVVGFAVKAGLVPFQVWLPRGYAAAPGPARAVMAGVCVNVAFYGLWRTLALLGRFGAPPGWLAGILLVLGGLTALLGIAHAAVSGRLSRVIAYSSVENSGLIITGFGVALTGAAVGNQRLTAVGLLAATLQMVAHTAAKSLLFSSAAGLEGGGGDDLESLRGMARKAPWSGFGLAVGAVTLAGLPPTAGFVSEWFLLESLMQQFRVTALGGRLTLAVAGAAVALTVGFAGVTFVRLVGMVVLGPPGSGASRSGDYGPVGRVAIVALAVCPLALAAVTPLEIRVIAAGLSPVVPGGLTTAALKSPWVLQPVFTGFSILSPPWLWVELPAMLGLVTLLAFGLSGRRLLRVRRVPAWRSATIGVAGPDSYTPFGFANPARRVLASVLHTRAEVAEVVPADDGPNQVPHLRYASDVVEVVETWLYRPGVRLFGVAVALARRLQSGRLDAYLLYMLIALVAVISVVTALALRRKTAMPSMSWSRAASISARARAGSADSATYRAASSLAPMTA